MSSRPTTPGENDGAATHVLATLDAISADQGDGVACIRDVLRALRRHLGLRVAFVSRLSAQRRLFVAVDADPAETRVTEGGEDPAEESFCAHVVAGRLPQIMRDARAEPAAAGLGATLAFPIGAHLSAPIRLRDGRVFGTLCAFDTQPEHSLGPRDLDLMRAVADVVGRRIDRDEARGRAASAFGRTLERTMIERRFAFVAQPIVDVATLGTRGHEFLARFELFPELSPDAVFRQADTEGAGGPLAAAILRDLRRMLAARAPEGDCFVNVVPAQLLEPEDLFRFVAGLEGRVVLELTEQTAYRADPALLSALAELRRRGARVALDDVGAGWSNLAALVAVRPEFIKLDGDLVRGVAESADRAALIDALRGFAERIGAALIAEGVETPADLEALRTLGVGMVQGRLVGAPAPLD